MKMLLSSVAGTENMALLSDGQVEHSRLLPVSSKCHAVPRLIVYLEPDRISGPKTEA